MSNSTTYGETLFDQLSETLRQFNSVIGPLSRAMHELTTSQIKTAQIESLRSVSRAASELSRSLDWSAATACLTEFRNILSDYSSIFKTVDWSAADIIRTLDIPRIDWSAWQTAPEQTPPDEDYDDDEVDDVVDVSDDFYNTAATVLEIALDPTVDIDIPDEVDATIQARPKTIPKKDWNLIVGVISLIISLLSLVLPQIRAELDSRVTAEQHAQTLAVVERIADAEERQAAAEERQVELLEQLLDSGEQSDDPLQDADRNLVTVDQGLDQPEDPNQPITEPKNSDAVDYDGDPLTDLSEAQ